MLYEKVFILKFINENSTEGNSLQVKDVVNQKFYKSKTKSNPQKTADYLTDLSRDKLILIGSTDLECSLDRQQYSVSVTSQGIELIELEDNKAAEKEWNIDTRRISEEANELAKKANEKAKYSNYIAILSAIAAIIALFKSA